MKQLSPLRLLLTSVGALDQVWLPPDAAVCLGQGLRGGGRRRSSSAGGGAGRLGRRLLHSLHGHEDAGELLQRHVAELRGEGTGWVLQTHQPARVTCADSQRDRHIQPAICYKKTTLGASTFQPINYK